LAAPSAGIVMLPRLDWWAVTDSSREYTEFRSRHPEILVLRQQWTQLYPTELNTKTVLFHHKDSTIRWLAMLDALPDPWSYRFNPERYITNLTVKGSLGPISFGYSQVSDENNTTRTSVLATAPLSILSRALVDGA